MLRRNVQIHCIYSLHNSEINHLSITVFKYMGVYVPTVFVKIFKHMYITYMLAGLLTNRVSTEFRRHGIPSVFFTSVYSVFRAELAAIPAEFRRFCDAEFHGIP